MTAGTVYRQGWTLEEVPWAAFDPSKVEPWLLHAVKAAALVEMNAPDYVSYLKRVFHDSGAKTLAAIEQWGREESQHGKALGRWAELADPGFSVDAAFRDFRTGYKPEHFRASDPRSIRGSRRGEMIARCVVESGTSPYYSAIRDATEEPVLRDIASRIAADEYRHYKLFYETLKAQAEPDLPFWRKLLVAAGRIGESSDDELCFAYYCANVPPAERAAHPYSRRHYAKESFATGLRVYRRSHIEKLTQMVAKVIGANPHGALARAANGLIWNMMRMRKGLGAGAWSAPTGLRPSASPASA
ncbi:MAG: ferritin-like domain-containing protein [Alphaproteobacteria bacterium]|nr:ferritin-like domain-containing protein [Alphaproteobacteria bacterium]